ncbi:hypothetical protein [Dongia sp. agr-C8]
MIGRLLAHGWISTFACALLIGVLAQRQFWSAVYICVLIFAIASEPVKLEDISLQPKNQRHRLIVFKNIYSTSIAIMALSVLVNYVCKILIVELQGDLPNLTSQLIHYSGMGSSLEPIVLACLQKNGNGLSDLARNGPVLIVATSDGASVLLSLRDLAMGTVVPIADEVRANTVLFILFTAGIVAALRKLIQFVGLFDRPPEVN